MAEKIYVGNAKKITTQYGDMYRLSVTAEDLEKMQANLDNGWVNLQMKERREPSAGGMTHYLEVDTWKPEPRDGEAPSAPKKDSGTEDITAEDLPF